MKNLSRATAVILAISALLFGGQMAHADNGNGNGGGHTPITICHKGDLITVDDNALKGHSNDSEDIFPTAGQTLTEADCARGLSSQPKTPCEVAGLSNVPATDARYTVSMDTDRDGVACEGGTGASKPPAVTPGAPVPGAPSLDSAPVAQKDANGNPIQFDSYGNPVKYDANGKPIQPSQLANTGPEGLLIGGGLATVLILGGLATVLLSRRTA